MQEPGACHLAVQSSALLPIFRGRFYNLLVAGRATTSFAQDEILYERGDRDRSFFFLLRGVVKTGTIAPDGREIVYDLRKERDVIGELCLFDEIRRDRAVALVPTVAVVVPFEEVLGSLAHNVALVREFATIFCGALARAYERIDSLAFDPVSLRTINVLRFLADKFGRPTTESIELPIYLTQEELAQIVAARRERVSTALNNLRREGIVRYSPRGHLRLDVQKLEQYRQSDVAATA
jgi:CRP-like cAMP-binding protein